MVELATQYHTITAVVEDKPGVLARVAGMFGRRGFNISNLSVGHSETHGLSRMTFVVEGDEWVVEQVTKQLYKLIDVVRVSDISSDSIVVREMALVKVRVTSETRTEIMRVADTFHAKVVDIATDSLIIEISSDEGEIDALVELLNPFTVKETMRTGRVAMTRGGAATGSMKPSLDTTDQSAPDTDVVP